ncbi:MAG: LuxR C-terminal-related transcriptional regulator [Lachnospiraceae bacterium]|nr:LuxR C-terminal-related transcriptional regulator [Lachnospiraceae bacterium]
MEEKESYTAMPLVSATFIPGHCLEAVQTMKNVRERQIAMAEYYYFIGQPEKAAQETEPLLVSPYIELRLSACLVYAYANLATGHLDRSIHALNEIQSTAEAMDENVSPQLRATASWLSRTAAVLLHLPPKDSTSYNMKDLNLLTPGLRAFVCYVQAHYAYLKEDYGMSLGIIETALAFQQETYPIPGIYLHLAATMDYMSLKRTEEAREHMQEAWKLAWPDGLLQPFGEHHGLLGGMVEATFKKDWPEEYKKIIAITYSFSEGWRKIHNPRAGSDVTDKLTTTEFAVAMLAARGWTNQEICDHMDISLHTVKYHISSILRKLDITKRSELKRYMLQ